MGLFPLLLSRHIAMDEGAALIPGATARLASRLDSASSVRFESEVFSTSSYAKTGEYDLIASLSLFTRAAARTTPDETVRAKDETTVIGRRQWRASDETLLHSVLGRLAEDGEAALLLPESYFDSHLYRGPQWREDAGDFSLDTVVSLSEELRPPDASEHSFSPCSRDIAGVDSSLRDLIQAQM